MPKGVYPPRPIVARRLISEQPTDPSQKLIALTRDQVALVDADDYPELVRWNWTAHWDPKMQGYYALRWDKALNRCITMHRFLMGFPQGLVADHINQNTLDNRRANLRAVTPSQNAMNRRLRRDNTSGVKGVSWNKPFHKWIARITMNGRETYLGGFDSFDEAAAVIREAREQEHGEYAREG